MAEIVTAFLDKTDPVDGLGIAVLFCVLIVPAFEPVPSAFAGIINLNPGISELVIIPPEVGVIVSCLSCFTVNPEIAVSAIV